MDRKDTKNEQKELQDSIVKQSAKLQQEKNKIVVTIPEIEMENTGFLTAILTVKVVESDYMPKVEDILNGYKKKIRMNGFREGMVPMGIVKKMYGEGIKAQQINDAVQAAINKYINEEKIKILGAPIMKKEDEEKEIDWKNSSDFSWRFDIGLQPDVSVEVSKKNKFTKYIIDVDDKIIDKYIADIRKKHGVMTSPEEVKDEDIAYCQYIEVDEGNEPIKNGLKHVGAISIRNVKDKLLFLGLKKGETIWIKPTELTDNIDDMCEIFNTDQEKMKSLMNSRFAFTVLTINRLTEAEIGQQLFDNVYGEGKIKTEGEFRDKIKQDAEKALKRDSDNLLYNHVVKYYVDKAKLKFPDEFLKRWLIHSSNGKITEENLEESYERYKVQISWRMIEYKIAVDNNIKITDDDVKQEIKDHAIENAKIRGATLSDKQLEEIVMKHMQDSNQRKAIYNHLYSLKFTQFIEDTCKVKEKKISYDEFYKIAKESE